MPQKSKKKRAPARRRRVRREPLPSLPEIKGIVEAMLDGIIEELSPANVQPFIEYVVEYSTSRFAALQGLGDAPLIIATPSDRTIRLLSAISARAAATEQTEDSIVDNLIASLGKPAHGFLQN